MTNPPFKIYQGYYRYGGSTGRKDMPIPRHPIERHRLGWIAAQAIRQNEHVENVPETKEPDSPKNFRAELVGDNSVRLSWDDNLELDLDGYILERADDNVDGAEYTQIGANPIVGETHLDEGLSYNEDYFYNIAAIDNYGNMSVKVSTSALTNASGVAADITAPSAPGGLTASGGVSAVKLTWSANQEPDLAATPYRIHRSVTSGAGYSEIGSAATEEYVNTGLSSETVYYYKITAQDSTGNISEFSVAVSGKADDTFAPSAVGNITTTELTSAINIAWSANTEPDLSGYKLFQSDASTGAWSSLYEGTATSANHTGLGNEVTKWYYAVALDLSGNTSVSGTAVSGSSSSVGVPDTTPPNAPTNLTTSAGTSAIALDWDDNTEPDLSSTPYTVYRSTTSDTGYSVLATAVSSNYTNSGLSDDTRYWYYVDARDQSNNVSPSSNQAWANPTDTFAPSAPGNLTVAVQNINLVLNWDDNTEYDLSGYEVYSSSAATSGFTLLNVTTDSAYTDAGLAVDTTKYYYVKASDVSANISTSSNIASGTTVSAVEVDNGYYTFTTYPSAASAYYVDATLGDDANDGLTSSTPKLTVSAGAALLRAGNGDHLLFKRGESWTDERFTSAGLWSESGKSRFEPTVIGAYGDLTLARPQFLMTSALSNTHWFSTEVSGAGDPVNYIWFMDLDISGTTDGQIGLKFANNNCSSIWIEGCRFRGLSDGILFNRAANQIKSVVLRGNAIHDCSNVGLKFENINGLTVQDNYIYNCGWSSGTQAAVDTRRNVLIDSDCDNVSFDRNISAKSSSDGVEIRSGGSVKYNLLTKNTVGVTFGLDPSGTNAALRTGECAYNLILNSEDHDGVVGGRGIEVGNVLSALIHDNLIVSGDSADLSSQAFGISLGQSTQTDGGLSGVAIYKNVIYGNGTPFAISGVTPSSECFDVSVMENVFHNDQANDLPSRYMFHAGSAGAGDTSNIGFSRNIWINDGYDSSSSDWTFYGADNTYSSMVSDWGMTNTSSQAVSYTNAGRTLADFINDKTGGAYTTEDDFFTQMLEQRRGLWYAEYEPVSAINYLREGFDLLPVVGDPEFSEQTASIDSKVIYVSYDNGDDANDGLSASSAKKYIDSGTALMRNGYPDMVLLERGNTWPTYGGVLNINRDHNGKNKYERTTIAAYGDVSSLRPIVSLRGTARFWTSYYLNTSTRYWNIASLEVTQDVSAHNLGLANGFMLLYAPGSAVSAGGGVVDFSLEDIHCHDMAGGINCAPAQASGQIHNFEINKCQFNDFWTSSTHSQGLLLSVQKNLRIIDTISDRNGYQVSSFDSLSVFSRNIYFGNHNNSDGVHTSGYMTFRSAGGNQWRYPGNHTYQIIYDPIGGGSRWGDSPNPHKPAEKAGEASFRYGYACSDGGPQFRVGNMISGILEDSIFAHNTNGGTHIILGVTQVPGTPAPGEITEQPIHGITIARNIIFNTEQQGVSIAGGYNAANEPSWLSGVNFHNNEIDTENNTTWAYAFGLNSQSYQGSAWDSVSGNNYKSDKGANAQCYFGSAVSVSAFSGLLTQTAATNNDSNYSNPYRTWADYVNWAERTTGSTDDNFYTNLRARRRGYWDPFMYTAKDVIDYIRDGYDKPPGPNRSYYKGV